MHQIHPVKRWAKAVFLGLMVGMSGALYGQTDSTILRESIEKAVNIVRPALVRIEVVETYYQEGREMKLEASGSGVVISPEGHVITNHHVAGHAKQIKCVFADKREVEAELIGADPLTDIAVLKLENDGSKQYPVAQFGDSSKTLVGQEVLAMGCPLALSQSVTLGIISNTEMIMPTWMREWGGMEQDGEDVGALVRWLGHDAEIHPGNSGGPLVDLEGRIIGINEIKMGLSGAIPGNLAKFVADQLIAEGKVKRAWLGLEVQPRLKHGTAARGVLVGGILKDSPAEAAGVSPGDILVSVAGTAVDVQFPEQLPDFNRLVSELKIGEPVEAVVERAGAEQRLMITPKEREPYEPKQYEMKAWGLTVRDLSYMMAKEMKRPSTDGVLVTSVRPGGPAGDAKPVIMEKDVLVEVAGKPVKSVRDLKEITDEIMAKSDTPTPALTGFERKTAKYVTVVKVGSKDLQDPGLEVKKAWLPVETQVITRDIAELLGQPDLTGFRVTNVYAGTTAETAGIQVGDLILAVDDEKMTASAPEHYEELPAYIREYKVGSVVNLKVRRGTAEMQVPVELVRAPELAREMKKYQDENFEFTVRDITFFDKATEKWEAVQRGVLVDQVKPGGWAALGQLAVSDLIVEVDGQPVNDVAAMEAVLKNTAESKPKAVVFKVVRGIHMLFLEFEPKWDTK